MLFNRTVIDTHKPIYTITITAIIIKIQFTKCCFAELQKCWEESPTAGIKVIEKKCFQRVLKPELLL